MRTGSRNKIPRITLNVNDKEGSVYVLGKRVESDGAIDSLRSGSVPRTQQTESHKVDPHAPSTNTRDN